MNEGVWEAARSVRPYLSEILGENLAEEVDRQLARILDSDGSAEGERQLRTILDAREGTSVYLGRVLDDEPRYRPPQVVTGLTRYSALPGQAAPVPADRFHCPRGDFVWYRPETGVEIPLCPTHSCVLVRS